MSAAEASFDDERLLLMKQASQCVEHAVQDGTFALCDTEHHVLEFTIRTQDSSLKRITALLKRLRQATADQVVTLCSDLEQLNLSMHTHELSASILENRPKSTQDMLAVLKVTVACICCVPEFRRLFILELWKEIDSLASDVKPTDKVGFSRFRWLYRLSIELHVIKVYNGHARIAGVLDKLVSIPCAHPTAFSDTLSLAHTG